MPSNNYQRYVSDELQKRRTKRTICEITIAVLLLLPAILLSFFCKPWINSLLFKNVELTPTSNGYQTWLNPPISTIRKYYLFNISNPLEIVEDPKDATIAVRDSPPYPYNIQTKKFNVKWSENNERISYDVERLYTRAATFDPASVNDTGVFVDLLRAIFRTQFQAKPAPAFHSNGGNEFFYRRNALEQLEGFTSDLFFSMRDKMVGPNRNKSGFVYRQNGSGLYSVSIKRDTSIKGQVLTFKSELVPFNITSANYPFPIYDSLTYPANLQEHLTLNLFNSDFCKPVLIEYHRTVPMFDGVDMYEYKLKLVDYENCADRADPRTCQEVDKIDVSKCISDSLPNNTIFLSKAHFYGAANETINEMNIQGYSPKAEEHDSTLYFEPTTGTPFQATYRMQLNIDATIDPMRIDEDGNLTPTDKRGVKRLLPIFWIDQDIKLDQALIRRIRTALKIRKYGPIICIPAAIVLVIIIIALIEIFGRRADRYIRYTRRGYTMAQS